MKRPTGPYNTDLSPSESVQQHLNMYALAASAAGVSLLALAQPTEAKIVYTAANVRIGINQRYDLDLNHDGITDFTLEESRRSYRSVCRRDGRAPRGQNKIRDLLDAMPDGGNGLEGRIYNPNALPKGAHIGGSQSFNNNVGSMAIHTYGWSWNPFVGRCGQINRAGGNWLNVTDRYLGLRFILHGETHYGWARLSVQIVTNMGIVTTLTGYAYETIANKAIIAGGTKGADDLASEDFGPGASLTNPIPDTPQPVSLGVLALGAQGVLLWQRQKATLEGD